MLSVTLIVILAIVMQCILFIVLKSKQSDSAVFKCQLEYETKLRTT